MWSRQETGAATAGKNADDPAAPGDYAAHFPGEESALCSILGHEPDILVVPDAYFLLVYRSREGVCFVTTDTTHILSNRDRIEEIFSGITVREPGAFLAGERG